MSTRYHTLDSIWFTPAMQPIIGIVAIDSDGNGWKAYIGTLPNVNANNKIEDEQYIAAHGVPLGRRLAIATFPQYNPEKFLD